MHRRFSLRVLLPLVTLAVCAGAAPVYASIPVPGQVAAFKKQVAALKKQVKSLRSANASLNARLISAQATIFQQKAEIAQLKAAPPPPAPTPAGALSQLEQMSGQQIFRTIFPPLVDWLNAHYSLAGTYSKYQSGTYLSFDFTCNSCG